MRKLQPPLDRHLLLQPAANGGQLVLQERRVLLQGNYYHY